MLNTNPSHRPVTLRRTSPLWLALRTTCLATGAGPRAAMLPLSTFFGSGVDRPVHPAPKSSSGRRRRFSSSRGSALWLVRGRGGDLAPRYWLDWSPQGASTRTAATTKRASLIQDAHKFELEADAGNHPPPKPRSRRDARADRFLDENDRHVQDAGDRPSPEQLIGQETGKGGVAGQDRANSMPSMIAAIMAASPAHCDGHR